MPDKTPFHRCTGKRCLRCWQNKLRHATKHDRDEANKINYPNELKKKLTEWENLPTAQKVKNLKKWVHELIF